MRPSGGTDETVEHLFAAGVLEVDLELVAFDCRDRAVAELAVEDALAEGEVRSTLIAEADRGCSRFDHALRLWIVTGPRGALPTGPAGGAGDVGKGIGALGPLRPPQALATGHCGFFVDVSLGQLGQE